MVALSDLRPVGAGLLLWNEQGKALIRQEASTNQYNLYDAGPIERWDEMIEQVIERFRLDTFGKASAEIVIHQTLTFVRAYASAHYCRQYGVLIGTAPDLPPKPIPCQGGSLEWIRLERLAPEECHPAFRYELSHYLKVAR